MEISERRTRQKVEIRKKRDLEEQCTDPTPI